METSDTGDAPVQESTTRHRSDEAVSSQSPDKCNMSNIVDIDKKFATEKSFEEGVQGNLAKHYNYWEDISASSNIVDIIKTGYKIPFIDDPKQAHFSNNNSASSNRQFVWDSILEYSERGSMYPIPCKSSIGSKKFQREIETDFRFEVS